jgi:two-component system, NtrC family, sensor kinase
MANIKASNYWIIPRCLNFRGWFVIVAAVLMANWIMAPLAAQDNPLVLTEAMFNRYHAISLSHLDGWKYTTSYDSSWLDSDFNDDQWEDISLKDFSFKYFDKKGKVEAWFRKDIVIDSSLANMQLGLLSFTKSAAAIYINGQLVSQYGVPDINPSVFESHIPNKRMSDPVFLVPGKIYTFSVYFVDHHSHIIEKITNHTVRLDPSIRLVNDKFIKGIIEEPNLKFTYFWLGPLFLLSGLFWLMYFQNRDEKTVSLVAVFTSALTMLCWSLNVAAPNFAGVITSFTFTLISVISGSIAVGIIPMIIDKLLTNKVSNIYRYALYIFGILNVIGFFVLKSNVGLSLSLLFLSLILSIHLSIKKRVQIKALQWVMLSGMLFTIFCIGIYLFIVLYDPRSLARNYVVTGIYLSMPISMLIYFTMRFKNNLLAARTSAAKVIQLSSEKEKLIEAQKSELEQQVKSRTEELVKSLDDLKSTQAQLIQAEKMASLGELTAGIAHEIQNPLNFVNNFAEVSVELIEEVMEEVKSQGLAPQQTITEILSDIQTNLTKINHHGKRADSIVKGMLEHSRTSSGEKVPTDINALCDEYLRLSYHGLRAKDKSFNATFETNFEADLPKVNGLPQDIGRVLLNLINNAFYAVHEKANLVQVKTQGIASPLEPNYKPTVTVSTKNLGDQIEISVKDNGNGIPDHIKDKIFQPFFTTKPTGQGTGLGLSLSYDIVKAHGGELKVVAKEGEGSEFIISLPIV